MFYISSVRHSTVLTKVEKLVQLTELYIIFVLVLTPPKYTEHSRNSQRTTYSM